MFFKHIIVLLFLFISISSSSKTDHPDVELELTPRAIDSLELVYFFKQTRGDLWKVKWDFKQPMDQWFGVKLNQYGQVFCIDLDGIPDCKANKHGGNHLHGSLPELNLPILEHLFLSSNQLSGAIPYFEGTPELLTLQLSGNRFSGQLPGFENLQKLVKLDLEYNLFSGEIPDFELKYLESLYLGNNRLTGVVPDFYACGNLSSLFVNSNELKGRLPDFSHLRNLKKLLLFNNNFEGKLPEYYQLEELNVLMVNKNELEGCCEVDKYDHFKMFDIGDTKLQDCNEGTLFIPDAFSPNHDGVNDYFRVEGMDDVHAEKNQWELEVWNANKMLVYANSNFLGEWDGMSSSDEALGEGLYIYLLRSSIGYTKNGTVYIRR